MLSVLMGDVVVRRVIDGVYWNVDVCEGGGYVVGSVGVERMFDVFLVYVVVVVDIDGIEERNNVLEGIIYVNIIISKICSWINWKINWLIICYIIKYYYN